MAEVSDRANRWLESQLPAIMRAIGITASAMVSVSLDTKWPPASVPDTPPHKRTGNLRAGVAHDEHSIPEGYETTISSSRAQGDPDVPFYLEFGTSRMAARPYMRPVRNKAPEYIPAIVRLVVDSEATYATTG